MKRVLRGGIFLLLLAGFICLTSCQAGGVDVLWEKEIAAVSWANGSEVQEVTAGAFDKADLKLAVTYADGTEKTVSLRKSMLSDSLKELVEEPGRYFTAISYHGFEVKVILVVSEPTYRVSFYGQGTLIETQLVRAGESAAEPDESKREKSGYRFLGWSADFSRVTSDMTVWGEYERIYTVTFYNGACAPIASFTTDESVVFPDAAACAMTGYRFLGWDRELTTVTADTAVYGVYEADTETDTDADGVPDYFEILLGLCYDKADSDGNGLTDGDEVNRYGTDPLLRDTDVDGIGDGAEIAAGTNPLTDPRFCPHTDWAEETGNNGKITATCRLCGTKKEYFGASHVHASGTTCRKQDENTHIFLCKDCGLPIQQTHNFTVKSEYLQSIVYICELCGAEKTVLRQQTAAELWEEEERALYEKLSPLTTPLVMQTDEFTDEDGTPSGSRAYLAGETSASVGASLTAAVRARNAAALERAKVDSITYRYLGAFVDATVTVKTATLTAETDAPDMYVHSVTDMMAAMVSGCFANLDTTKEGNAFSFTLPHYNAARDDGGYLLPYMQALSLGSEKRYLLASDYFMGILRAMAVLPVNVAQLARVSDMIGDANADGTFGDTADFLQFTQSAAYTWEWICRAAQAVSSDVTVGLTLRTESLAFEKAVAAASGLRAVVRGADGTLSFTEDTAAWELFAAQLCASLGGRGVCAVDGEVDLCDLRVDFAENRMLFGAMETLGAAEDDAFAAMRGDSFGYVFVPLPAYAGGTVAVIDTAAHVGAIGVNSKNFTAASAFWNAGTACSRTVWEKYLAVYVSRDNAHLLMEMRDAVTDDMTGVAEELLVSASHISGDDFVSRLLCGADGTYRDNTDFAVSYQATLADKNDALSRFVRALAGK